VSDKLHLPRDSTADAPYSLFVTPELAGWTYAGLRVVDLAEGASHAFSTRDEEMVVLPLEGGCTVTCDGQRFDVRGRDGVFAGATDIVYLPRDADVTISAATRGRFALPSARCRRRLAPLHRRAEDVPVELRGAGSCSRRVINFCSADETYADKLIAVEVLTPGGNWSSYPPHKHDEQRPGETELEEIYYYEVADGPAGPGKAYQRVYGSIDLLAEVRSGDVVLIPHGWHGPSMAAPGYDLYYLNVMAGPGDERAWLICDDPPHAWVRDTWKDRP
jgi:5-deoxy-glucuronate isomerase